MEYHYNKKSIWKWILLYVIIGVIAYAFIYYFFFYKSEGYLENSQTKNNETSDWKMYTNVQYGYQIQYPVDVKLFDKMGLGHIENSQNIEITPKDSLSYLSIYAGDLAKYSKCPQSDYIYTQVIINNMKFFKADVSTEYQGMNSPNQIATSYCTLNNNGDQYILTIRNTYQPTSVLLQIMNTFKFTNQLTQVSDWKTYKNDAHGFELKHPNNLSPVPAASCNSIEGTCLIRFSKTVNSRGEFKFGVYINNDEILPTTSLEEDTKLQWILLTHLEDSIDLHPITINGHKAVFFDVIKNDESARYYFLKNDTGTVIYGLFFPSGFDYDSVLASFKLIK